MEAYKGEDIQLMLHMLSVTLKNRLYVNIVVKISTTTNRAT